MPIYEYKCAECGAHFEKMQKVAEKPLTVCEVCGGKLEKQWSLSGIQFKGAGWYVHEYSNKMKDPNAAKTEKTGGKTEKAEKAETSEKTSAAESTAKTESASNSTSETKTDSKKEAATKKD